MRLTLWMLAVVLIAPLVLSAISAATAEGQIAQPNVSSDKPPEAGSGAPEAPAGAVADTPWYADPVSWIVGAAILLVGITIGWAVTRGAEGDRRPRGTTPATPG